MQRLKGRPRNDEGDPVAIAYALFKDQDNNPFKCTPYQAPIMRAIVARQHHHIIVLAATQAGKTTLVGAAVPLLAITRPNSQIPIISYTKAQTKIMFRKIRTHLLSDNTHVRALVDESKPLTADEINLTNGSRISCLTAGVNSKGDQLLGFNGTDVFLDESVLISDEIFSEKIKRMLGATLPDGTRRMLVETTTPHFCNHTYRDWTDGDVLKFKFTWREAVAAGVMNQDFIDERKEEMSPNLFNIWYECQWPKDGELHFIQPSWVENALVLNLPNEKPILTAYGCDISASGGDYTVILQLDKYKNDLYSVPFIHYFRGKPLTFTSGKIIQFARKFRPDWIAVDVLGVGQGVYDNLREVEDIRGSVRIFKASHTAFNKRMYYNRKTEVAVEMQKLFRSGRIKIIDHPMLRKDLNALTPITLTGRGLLKITDPNESPDFTDALIMALAQFPTKKIQPTTIPFGYSELEKNKTKWYENIPRRADDSKLR